MTPRTAPPTVYTIPELERLRCEMGLSRQQLLRAIGAKPNRWRFFTDDALVDPAFFARARAVHRLYNVWKQTLLAQLPEAALDAKELATLLDIPENSARVLLHRWASDQQFHTDLGVYGKDPEEYAYQRRYIVDREVLTHLFEVNEEILEPRVYDADGHDLGWPRGREALRGPLAHAFLKWLHRLNEEAAQ